VTDDDRPRSVDWLTPNYPWADDPIPGSFHRTQARAVVRAGVGVRVIAPTPFAPFPLSRVSERWRRYAAAPKRQTDESVEIVRPRYLAIPGEPGWAQVSRSVAAAARGAIGGHPAPLIHAHFITPCGMAARRLTRDSDRPYVITVHGHDATSWPAAHADALDEYRAAVRDAAAVITVSRALGAKVEALTDTATLTLPLGSDHARLAGLKLPKDEARRRLGIPADRTLVLFVGRLLPLKGVRELVDALLTLESPFLGVLLGEGPLGGHRSDEDPSGERLRYAGGQPAEGVAAWMSAADMLVLPSYQEGLPTVLVEAGSLGLPVIASAVDGTPELLGTDRGVLLPAIDAPSIREAILAVAADPAAATARADRLHEHVLAEYDVDRNAVRLVDLYSRVIAGRDPGLAS
jgi:teichuronic acid biosynthesis glycosyltransferase TuaC